MQKTVSLFFLVLLSINSFAQNSNAPIEMADALYANGKIYIVVAVLLIIFTGIIIFLIRMDRKLSKLEKQVEDKSL